MSAEIHSLNQTGSVGEAVGHVAEEVDRGAIKVVVLVVDAYGRISGEGFGTVTFPDLCLFGTFLQHRAMAHVDGKVE